MINMGGGGVTEVVGGDDRGLCRALRLPRPLVPLIRTRLILTPIPNTISNGGEIRSVQRCQTLMRPVMVMGSHTIAAPAALNVVQNVARVIPNMQDGTARLIFLPTLPMSGAAYVEGMTVQQHLSR